MKKTRITNKTLKGKSVKPSNTNRVKRDAHIGNVIKTADHTRQDIGTRTHYCNPVAAAKAKEQADEVRNSRAPFDRHKFEEFVDNDPLFSKLHLLSTSDE